jgi:hypothetical protein
MKRRRWVRGQVRGRREREDGEGERFQVFHSKEEEVKTTNPSGFWFLGFLLLLLLLGFELSAKQALFHLSHTSSPHLYVLTPPIREIQEFFSMNTILFHS